MRFRVLLVVVVALFATTCGGKGSVNPTQPGAITPGVVSFTASPNPAPWKGTATLQWSCENATAVSIPGVVDDGPASGSVPTPVLDESRVFTAICKGPTGVSGPKNVAVDVVPRITTYSAVASSSGPLKLGDTLSVSFAGQCATEGFLYLYMYRDDGVVRGMDGLGCKVGVTIPPVTSGGTVDSLLSFGRGHAVTFRIVFTDTKGKIIATPDLPNGASWVTLQFAD